MNENTRQIIGKTFPWIEKRLGHRWWVHKKGVAYREDGITSADVETIIPVRIPPIVEKLVFGK